MRILQCMGYSPCICKTGALAVCACSLWQVDSHTAYLAMQLTLHTLGCFAAPSSPPVGAVIFASDSLPSFICRLMPACSAVRPAPLRHGEKCRGYGMRIAEYIFFREYIYLLPVLYIHAIYPPDRVKKYIQSAPKLYNILRIAYMKLYHVAKFRSMKSSSSKI